MLASTLGFAAVDALLKGERGKAAGIRSGNIVLTPFEEAIGKENPLNDEHINMAKILAL